MNHKVQIPVSALLSALLFSITLTGEIQAGESRAQNFIIPGVTDTSAETAPEGGSDKAQFYEDDPGNPWILGYRWRGEPPSTLDLEGAMVQESGFSAPLINQLQARRAFQYYATNSVTTGIRFKVKIMQGEGPMTVELIEFRLTDPNQWEVKSDEDVQIKTIHASATLTPGQEARLSGGVQVPDKL